MQKFGGGVDLLYFLVGSHQSSVRPSDDALGPLTLMLRPQRARLSYFTILLNILNYAASLRMLHVNQRIWRYLGILRPVAWLQILIFGDF